MSFVFFWNPEQANGLYSQWHIGDFELDGQVYNCAEQYMMAEKARVFNDEQRLEAILQAGTPGAQKKLGRQVQGFESELWQAPQSCQRPLCWLIVWRGNMAKFSQHEERRRELLATAEQALVEASPYDKIWGIGFRAEDPEACQPELWRGHNWLGEVLMSVRANLLADASPYLSSHDPRQPAL